MIHPEVDVIGSQSLCEPRVGSRKKETRAGLSMQASAFHTISFSGLRRLESCLYALGLLKPPRLGVESGSCGCPRTGR